MSTNEQDVVEKKALPTQDTENCIDKNLTNVVESTIARNVGTFGNRDVAPLKFGGHCYYVRRCMNGEMVDPDAPWRRELDGIELPESFADRSRWATVLARGPAVGRPCGEAHRKLHSEKCADGISRPRPRCVQDNVEIGDMVLCPSLGWTYDDIGIERSAFDKNEFFIEENKPRAILKRNSPTDSEIDP